MLQRFKKPTGSDKAAPVEVVIDKSKTKNQGSKASTADSKKAVKSNDKANQSIKGGLAADAVRLLVDELDPPIQSQIHRFALRLQASVAMSALKVMSVITLCLLIACITLVFYSSGNHMIIAIDSNGRMYAVEHAKLGTYQYTQTQVVGFATDTIYEVFDINFTNFTRRLENVTNERFTSAGKADLVEAMRPLLKDLSDTKGVLMVQPVIGQVGAVVKESVNKDEWVVRVPVVLTIKGANTEAISNQRMMTVVVKRVDDINNSKGLAVAQIVQGTM